jgi:DNA-binding PadR family transcriptional regulator
MSALRVTIRRSKHTKNFTVIANSTLNDERLKLNEQGALDRLLSLPDDWEIHPKDLMKRWGIGKGSLYGIISSLRKTGYMERLVERDADGRVSKYVYIVYDTPQTDLQEAAKQEPVEQEPAKHRVRNARKRPLPGLQEPAQQEPDKRDAYKEQRVTKNREITKNTSTGTGVGTDRDDGLLEISSEGLSAVPVKRRRPGRAKSKAVTESSSETSKRRSSTSSSVTTSKRRSRSIAPPPITIDQGERSSRWDDNFFECDICPESPCREPEHQKTVKPVKVEMEEKKPAQKRGSRKPSEQTADGAIDSIVAKIESEQLPVAAFMKGVA